MKKPKFNMWQNAAYMIATAWSTCKSVVWLCVISAALAVVTGILKLLITPQILALVEVGAPLGELISAILVFTGGLILTGALSAYVQGNTLFGRVSVRTEIIRRVQHSNLTTSYPNIINKERMSMLDKAYESTDSNWSASEAIWNTLTGLLTNAAGFVVYLILLSSLEPWIIAVVLVTTVGGYLATMRINGWGYRHREEESVIERKISYIYYEAEDYKAGKDIRMFGMVGWLKSVLNSAIAAKQAFVERREKVYIWANVIDVVLAFARNGIAYIYLIALVLNDGLTAAEFLLYFTAISGFTAWVSGIMSELETLHKQGLEISNIRELITFPEPFKLDDGLPLEPSLGASYTLELRGVSYRYPDAEADVLTNINLTIGAGEKLAIVGLNGAGKTTLVKLLCGFLDPTEGEVLLNGRDIRQFNRRDIYRHFSAVFQDFSIFPSTILENITQSADECDMERVRECIRRAGLTQRIDDLSNGYDTHVTRDLYDDGVELSGGETQRLMLARALYKNAPIIVLDEPTAALDPLAESDMYNKYNELTGGRTSVYISHRLASTRFCNRVILLDGASIAEEGTHEGLLALGKKYAELFEIQSRYYQKGDVEIGC